MKDIYTRNIPAITSDEQELLKNKSVLVVGCGGLGGYAIEYLARLGVGRITAVDGDTFSESNLNRQLLSSIATLGQPKSEVAVDRIHSINPNIEAIAVKEFFTEDNAARLLDGIDLVIDALDNVAARFVLEYACEKAGITIIHGAVQGWNMQVTVAQPGSRTLHSIYKINGSEDNVSNDNSLDDKTCLCPTPACCAAIQVAEALKILVGRESTLSGQILFVDLLTIESYTIPLQ